MAIPQTFIDELVTRADIVEIVGRYVPLKKAGANFMGLCPFHGEKSPSFSVSPTKQFFHCFGCGKSGNAIGFLMDHTGLNFVEAVQSLAQQYGMTVPQEEASPQERERAQAQREKQGTLTGVLAKADEAYRKQLRSAPRAVQYLKGRGLSGQIAKRFGLGYAAEGWRNLASVFPHYDDPLLVESGLVIAHSDETGGEEKRYDRFRDRITFPIRNIKGECIGFGARVLGDEKPKYLNSPETPVFSKGRELYGLFEARNALREAGYALVTEGYMDVVALAQLGFPQTVATLGTACTAEHVHKLFRFTDAVVFSFDGDAAGRRAARKALEAALPYASDVRSIKFLFLPPEHDPDSFIRAHGAEAFAHCVAEAMPLSRFLIEAVRDGLDLDSAEGRAHLSAKAQPLWAQLPDGALKLQLLAELAALAHLSAADLTALWQGGTPAPRSAAPQARRNPRARAARSGPQSSQLTRADFALRLLLGHSDLWDQLSAEEHGLLCALPPPHGTLFTWLEGQLLEHGALSWGALREALQTHTQADAALQLMRDFVPNGASSADASDELRDLLNRMLVDHLKTLETQAIEAGASQPAALQRYQELRSRRLQLQLLLEKS